MASTQMLESIRTCAQRIGNDNLRNELLGKIDQLSGELGVHGQERARAGDFPTPFCAASAAGPPPGILYDPPI